MSAIANTIFSPELAARFDKLVTIYPVKRSALIPMLLYAQDEIGYVSEGAIPGDREAAGPVRHRGALGAELLLDAADEACGQVLNVQVCTNISCMLRGGYEILDHCKAKLGIGHKQTTADGVFSLEEVECIGACCWAPAMQVNYDFHEDLTTGEGGRDYRDLPRRPGKGLAE